MTAPQCHRSSTAGSLKTVSSTVFSKTADSPERVSIILGVVIRYEITVFGDGRITFLSRNRCPRAGHVSPTWSAGHLGKQATTAQQRLSAAYQDNAALV